MKNLIRDHADESRVNKDLSDEHRRNGCLIPIFSVVVGIVGLCLLSNSLSLALIAAVILSSIAIYSHRYHWRLADELKVASFRGRYECNCGARFDDLYGICPACKVDLSNAWHSLLVEETGVAEVPPPETKPITNYMEEVRAVDQVVATSSEEAETTSKAAATPHPMAPEAPAETDSIDSPAYVHINPEISDGLAIKSHVRVLGQMNLMSQPYAGRSVARWRTYLVVLFFGAVLTVIGFVAGRYSASNDRDRYYLKTAISSVGREVIYRLDRRTGKMWRVNGSFMEPIVEVGLGDK